MGVNDKQTTPPRLPSAEEVMKTNAKTFSLAARLLPSAQRDPVERLYSFCRYADDLADDSSAGVNNSQLLRLREEIASGKCSSAAGKDFIDLQLRCEIPTEVALDFLDELIADQYPRQFREVGELIRYSYGVASTVGLMMCHVFGVKHARAFPFAIDLGIAMQITNVCRDVMEDARLDRVYVPSSLAGFELDPKRLTAGDADHRQAAFIAIQRLLTIADRYYSSARRGVHYLPKRVRAAVLVAADLYQAIGAVILAEPHHYWQRRAVVSMPRKIGLVLFALLNCYRDPMIRGQLPPVIHQAELHSPLASNSPASIHRIRNDVATTS